MSVLILFYIMVCVHRQISYTLLCRGSAYLQGITYVTCIVVVKNLHSVQRTDVLRHDFVRWLAKHSQVLMLILYDEGVRMKIIIEYRVYI